MLDRNLRTARINAITVLHDEPEKAARFVRDTMGAIDVDAELCRKVALADGVDNGCERVTSGGLTYQYMRPTPSLLGSQEFYRKHGALIYSYQVAVEDVDAAVDALVAAGAVLVGKDGLLGHAFVDATEKCGLVFELMPKADELPCYTDKRYPGDIGVFQHSEVVVHDPKACRDWMVEVLGAEDVETDVARRIGTGSDCTGDPEKDAAAARIATESAAKLGVDIVPGCEHVLWGGYVFQIITPFPHLPYWLEFLRDHGNLTHNICYHTHPTMTDIPSLLASMESFGAKELKFPGDEHSASWNFGYQGLYGPDNDDPDRICWCVQIDALEQSSILWEFIPMCFRWNCSTGYFFD